MQDRQHPRRINLAAVTIAVALVSLWQQSLTIYSAGGFSLSTASPNMLVAMACTMFIITMVGAIIWSNVREVRRASRLAFIDDLTGLPNRRGFDRRLRERAAELARTGKAFGLLYLDLDRFKNVNDSYGHEAGDEVIRQFAARMRKLLGKDDMLARLAGDEFAMILSSASGRRSLQMAAAHVFDAMAEPFDCKTTLIYSGLSIGATLADRPGTGAMEILRHADFALLQAKESGRNNLQIFNPSMAERIRTRGQLENDLREAIAHDRFQIRYQPMISQTGDEVIGVEALVRWIHPVRGAIMPAVFIPIAEEIGLIDRLDEFVLRRACTEIRDFGPVKLAVNISSSRFMRPEFAEQVHAIVEETGFDPHNLELEITEGVFLEDPAKIARTVETFKAMGIRIALDDFGTGYSSMSYLRDHTLDRIKIDRSFVSQIGHSVRSLNLVSKLIDLGGSLGLNVTVEGVETEAQRKLLSDSKVEMQGFLFSHPVSLEQLRDYCGPDQVPANDASASPASQSMRVASSS